MRKLSAALAAFVLPMVTLTTAALADDDKTYPGAMCRSITPLTLSTGPNVTLSQIVGEINEKAVGLNVENGAMLNFGAGPQTWICPVVREWMNEQPEYARITVQENGSEPVKCEFEAKTYLGEGSIGGGTPSKRQTKTLTQSPLTQAVVYEWGAGETEALIDIAPNHGYYFSDVKSLARGGPLGAPKGVFPV